jgi:hypothetical protein
MQHLLADLTFNKKAQNNCASLCGARSFAQTTRTRAYYRESDLALATLTLR